MVLDKQEICISTVRERGQQRRAGEQTVESNHRIESEPRLASGAGQLVSDVGAVGWDQPRNANGFDHHPHSLRYDHLVIGLGSITNFYALPGLEERALTMKSLGDAIRLRNHLIAHLEEADGECVAQKKPLLTFVVAGGGFSGVETVAGLNDFVRDALPSYSHLKEDMLRVVLVHPGPVILPELGEKLGAYARKKLAERGVEIRVNTKVSAASARGIELSDGTLIESNTVVWTAGTSPNPLLQADTALMCSQQLSSGAIRMSLGFRHADCSGKSGAGRNSTTCSDLQPTESKRRAFAALGSSATVDVG